MCCIKGKLSDCYGNFTLIVAFKHFDLLKMNESLMPKQFIKKVLINNISDLVSNEYYWLSFTLMAIGIEFLGKCIDINQKDWNKGKSKDNFERAINNLEAFNTYRPYLKKYGYNIWDSYRNGFAHSFVPKRLITLSSGKNGMTHFKEYKDEKGNSKLNFKCEILYNDFKNACNEVIKKRFLPENNKMNMPLLFVPKI